MSVVGNDPSGGLSDLADQERALLGRIRAASELLGRTDCLDEEERAEVHAILEAIRHDSEFHASILAALPREVPRA